MIFLLLSWTAGISALVSSDTTLSMIEFVCSVPAPVGYYLKRIDLARISRFADVFARCQSVECLEAVCVIGGVEEVAEMHSELIMVFVVMPLDSSVFDCAVHPLDFSIRPWMIWLG